MSQLIGKSIRGLGFDVGMRNLGFAIVNYTFMGHEADYRTEFQVEQLGLIDLGTLKTRDAVDELVKELDVRSDQFHNVDIVNIEVQHKRGHENVKCISFALQTYFLCRCPTVPIEFISGRSKLTVYEGKEIAVPSGLSIYKQTKYKSIQHALHVLNTPQNLYWKSFVSQLEKRDDVCDAFLQCCYATKRKYKAENRVKRPRGRPSSSPQLQLIVLDEDIQSDGESAR